MKLSNSFLNTGLNLVNNLVSNRLDSLISDTNQLASTLTRNSSSNSKSHSNTHVLPSDIRKHYNKLYSHGAILECNYAVFVQDIFNIQGKSGIHVPWFANDFPMSWLATDTEFSIGGKDSESFYAGSYQCNYLTQQTSDTIEVTFIETKNGDIANSAKLCGDIAMPSDGSVREPKYYTFALFVMVFGDKRDLRNPTLKASYLAAAKDGSISLSSSGRSEVAKTQVTFQKIRPFDLYKDSVRW